MDREEAGGLQSMKLKKDLVTKQQQKQFKTRNGTVLGFSKETENRITIPIDIYLSTCVCV